MPDPEGEEEKKLWKVDAAIYRKGKETSFPARLVESLKTAGRSALFAVLLVYPLMLVILGIVFGGLIFWATLGGSIALIWLILTKAGYAKNFEQSNPRLLRQLTALTIAFVILVGYYEALFHFGVWVLPVLLAILSVGIVYVFRRGP
jgi:hypothetical protein